MSSSPTPRAARRARALACLAALACLLVLLLGRAGPAHAHDFRPLLLQLHEVDAGRFELRMLVPATSSAGPIGEGELRPLVPEPCTPTWRSPISATLDCDERGLVGTLGVEGTDRHPVDVVIAIQYLDGSRVSAVLAPDDPPLLLGGPDPRSRLQLLRDYVALGVEHILLGFDHLLFVLALVLLVPSPASLLWTVTAFTLAHSITLACATLELLALPSPPVEAGIALSIVLLAHELALPEHERDTLTWRAPWLVAFGFGLLHGFGFAGALAEVGLPSAHVPLALLAFNLGVELGQLGVVALVLVALALLRRVHARGRMLVVYGIGSLAAAWLIDRVLDFVA